jgi:hypothetical protein
MGLPTGVMMKEGLSVSTKMLAVLDLFDGEAQNAKVEALSVIADACNPHFCVLVHLRM